MPLGRLGPVGIRMIRWLGAGRSTFANAAVRVCILASRAFALGLATRLVVVARS